VPSSRLSSILSRRRLARSKTLPLSRWLRMLLNSVSLSLIPLCFSSCVLRLAVRAAALLMVTGS